MSNLLLGECKTDFELWLSKQEVAPYASMVYDIPFTVFYSYFNDFLDSVEIFPFIEYHEHIKQFSGKIKDTKKSLRLDLGIFKNRIEARKDLVLKANEIYNKREK